MAVTKMALGAVIVAGTLLLAGCGTAPWNQPQFAKTHAASPHATSVHVQPTPARSPGGARDDLAGDRAQHILHAGDVRLTATYWSPVSLSSWHPAAVKPIALSLTATSTTNTALPIFLASAAMDVTVHRSDGKTRQLLPQVDRATTGPGDAMNAPYSYGQNFIIPAVDADATSLTLVFTYTVLEQTTPTSTEYSHQSAIDTLTVPLASAP